MLRDQQTGPVEFRRLVHELAVYLVYEAVADIAVESIPVQTPMGLADGVRQSEEVALVPILRAGLGMVDGALTVLPGACVWHVGLFRDEASLRPVEYFHRVPATATPDRCLILDPMLATGGSALAAIGILKRAGAQRISFVGILAAPEGIEAVRAAYPDVSITVAEVDERLNEIGFIVPGLGDAGDRQFGTGFGD